jgi:hypothetical protein
MIRMRVALVALRASHANQMSTFADPCSGTPVGISRLA